MLLLVSNVDLMTIGKKLISIFGTPPAVRNQADFPQPSATTSEASGWGSIDGGGTSGDDSSNDEDSGHADSKATAIDTTGFTRLKRSRIREHAEQRACRVAASVQGTNHCELLTTRLSGGYSFCAQVIALCSVRRLIDVLFLFIYLFSLSNC